MPGNAQQTGSTFLNDLSTGSDYVLAFGIPVAVLALGLWILIAALRNRKD